MPYKMETLVLNPGEAGIIFYLSNKAIRREYENCQEYSSDRSLQII